MVKKEAEVTPLTKTIAEAVEPPVEGVTDAATGARISPQFTVKSKEAGYVGSAWIRDGQYGRYLSVTINMDVPKGARLYILPNRANAGLLG